MAINDEWKAALDVFVKNTMVDWSIREELADVLRSAIEARDEALKKATDKLKELVTGATKPAIRPRVAAFMLGHFCSRCFSAEPCGCGSVPVRGPAVRITVTESDIAWLEGLLSDSDGKSFRMKIASEEDDPRYGKIEVELDPERGFDAAAYHVQALIYDQARRVAVFMIEGES